MHTNLVICQYQQPGPGAVITGRGETVHCTFISRTNETLTTTIQYSVQQGTRKLQANKYKPQLRNSTVQQITVHYPPLCNLPEGTFHHLSSCGPAGGLIRPDRGNRFNISDQQSDQSGMMIPYETQFKWRRPPPTQSQLRSRFTASQTLVFSCVATLQTILFVNFFFLFSFFFFFLYSCLSHPKYEHAKSTESDPN